MAEVHDQFVAALARLEADREVEPLVDLFAADAELTKLGHHTSRGTDGARRFWTDYRNSFGEIRSTFHTVTEAGGRAVLEWVAAGTLPDGHRVRYSGASVVEADGDRISRFRTYYDSAAFVSGLPASRTPS